MVTPGDPRTGDSESVATVLETVHREEWARIVAGLVRRYGDLDLAEDAAADAFATAAQRWPRDGAPPNRGAWITTVAQRRAVDRLRREGVRQEKHREALRLHEGEDSAPTSAVGDDRLRLMFLCCHPVLTAEAGVALTLRLLGGLTVPEIARAFLVRDSTVGQRISRAKAKLRTAGVPYRVPSQEDLPARIDGVLTVLYLIFNEGYLSTSEGSAPLRRDLTAEALRLTRLAHDLLPADTEISGLLALMLLIEARSGARLTTDGELVRLDEQDRRLWAPAPIQEASRLRARAHSALRAAGRRPGRYLLLADVNAEHVAAPTARDTDWSRIVALYEQLERIDPGPILALNKAIAISERDTPRAGLEELDRLEEQLAGNPRFHLARAELLRGAERPLEALKAYDSALALTTNRAEIALMTRRRDGLETSDRRGDHAGHTHTPGEAP